MGHLHLHHNSIKGKKKNSGKPQYSTVVLEHLDNNPESSGSANFESRCLTVPVLLLRFFVLPLSWLCRRS